MKALIILPSFDMSVGGGVASCLSNMCKGLVLNDVEVTVLTTNATKLKTPLDVPLDRTITRSGIKIRYFPATFGSRFLFDSRSLIHYLRHEVTHYDIVYVSAVWQWIGIATVKVCQQHKVPVIVGIHGSFASELRRKNKLVKYVYYSLFLKRSLKSASAIHLTTAAELDQASDWLATLPGFIVPNAVDPDHFQHVTESKTIFRSSLGIPEDAHVLITVGRPDWKKRVDLLIRALSGNPDWYLIVVGSQENTLARNWNHLAHHIGVHERIIWTGFLDVTKLNEAYTAADLFALLSHNENFGMVVVEAMLCGLPVVVSHEVGIWELLHDHNIGLSLSLDEAAVSNMLNDFSHSRGLDVWRNRAERAREVACELFAPVKIGILMKQAFQNILQGNRSEECRWYK